MDKRKVWDRREAMALSAAAAAAGMGLVPAAPAGAAPRTLTPRLLPAQRSWTPVPQQAPARDGMAPLPGVQLYYWDTGGDGEAVLLMHPITGSALVWGYQQPVFANAGYRVIAFSRRGFARSESGAPGETSYAVDDIEALLDYLKVGKFHMVGSAAGAFVVPDYAQSHPDRLLSMVVSCSQGGVTEKSYRDKIAAINPPALGALPVSFRELGPSYRAANPEGRAQWERLEEHSRSGPGLVRQAARNRIDFADLEKIRVPTLVMPGDADLYGPPALALEFASHVQGSEVAILSESGHSGYWEQPDAFNATVLEFIGRHRAGR